MQLSNLQAELADAILMADDTIDCAEPAAHIAIYHNNVMSTLINTLRTTFPLIEKLVGEDFFRITAKEYIKHYPSRHSNLNAYGNYFSDFLASYAPVHNLIYLAEVAQFEWLCHQVNIAPDHARFDLKKLSHIAPAHYHELHFILHPASHLQRFHYPMLDIIEICREDADITLDITKGGINLLMIRRDQDISLVPLTNAEFTFLEMLQDGKSVSEALNTALMLDAQFNLEEKLPAWIKDKTLIDCYLRS